MLVAKIGWLTEIVFTTVDWSRWHTYNCSDYNTLILVMRMWILKGWKSNNNVHHLHTYMHVCGKLADGHLNNIATLTTLIYLSYNYNFMHAHWYCVYELYGVYK